MSAREFWNEQLNGINFDVLGDSHHLPPRFIEVAALRVKQAYFFHIVLNHDDKLRDCTITYITEFAKLFGGTDEEISRDLLIPLGLVPNTKLLNVREKERSLSIGVGDKIICFMTGARKRLGFYFTRSLEKD